MNRPRNARPTTRLYQGDDHPSFRVFMWNAGGLTPEKFSELSLFINNLSPDAYAIVEAGLATDNIDSYQCQGYCTYTLPRARQVASGMIIGVKNSLTSRMTIRKEMNSNDSLEAVELELWCKKMRNRFFFLYNPPRNKPCLNWLESNWDHSCIVLGDFNAHSTRWGYSSNDNTGDIVEEFIDSNPVEFVDNEQGLPTFLAYSGNLSHPDLVLAHVHIAPRISHTVTAAPGGAGHKILLVELDKLNGKVLQQSWARWNIKRANWATYRECTDEKINDLISDASVDKWFLNLRTSILEAAQKSIPRGAVKKYKPFWTPHLQRLKRVKEKARAEAERTQTIESLGKLKLHSTELREAIKRAKTECYSSYLEKLDFRRDGVRAHKFLSRLNKSPAVPKSPIIYKGKEITDDKATATAFCKHYAAVSNYQHSKTNGHPSKTMPALCLEDGDHEIFNAPFNLNELQMALKETRRGKSAGPDGILPEFLLNLGSKSKLEVLKFLNYVWLKGDIPAEWKKAEIIPIHKKGKPAECISSYRPIALTSVFGKILERMALARMMMFVERKKLISENQAGFRRHRSTVDHIVRFTQDIKDGFQHKQSTIAALVDFSTAFDRVWRRLLLTTMGQWGIHGNLYRYIKSFLSQRFIRVRYNQGLSGYRQTRQGVPQGSVLSPMLFNILINSLITTIEENNPGIRALLYADDLLLWGTSSSIPALEECLNKALKTLANWTEKNEMKVNASKTNFQLFTLSPKPPKIIIRYENTELEQTDAAVYLGVCLDSRLSWNKQADAAVVKGVSRMKLIKRLAGTTWGASQDLLTKAYNSYVMPAIMYGSEAMVTASATTVGKLEKTQNMALRLITGAAKSTPVAAMLCQTGLNPVIANIEGAALKLNERIKRIGDEYWKSYKPPIVRLKTQKNFSHKVNDLLEEVGEPLHNRESFPKEKYILPFSYDLTLTEEVSKPKDDPVVLKAVALETIHTRYPNSNWLHVYTDGSAEGSLKNSGAGVYSSSFTLSAPIGRNASNYDGEIGAVLMALREIVKRSEENTVILVDSQSAILALGSSRCSSSSTALQECFDLKRRIEEKGRNVHLQWIPSHCGILGNEEADRLAREGAQQDQPETAITLNTAKKLINASLKVKYTSRAVEAGRGKAWEILLNQQIPQHLPRKESVAMFRMTTGHDYLQKHLKRIGIVNSATCPLCQEGEMDSHHLMLCPALAIIVRDTNRSTLVDRYWAARHRMANIPVVGVG